MSIKNRKKQGNKESRKQGTGRLFIFSKLLCLIASLLPCFIILLTPGTGRTEIIDKVVAVVDGDIITLSELENASNSTYRGPTGKTGQRQQLARREILDSMIDDILIRHAMDKAKITVDEDDLARAIANVLRQNRMTPEQLHADLASKGISYETYKQQIARQIKYIKFVNQVIGQQVKLSDRELRDYYESNKSEFGGESSNFESAKEAVYDALYEKRSQEALKNFVLQQRQKAYIDVRLD
jgi:peptidyl-prolyl cis-trans isomerase SurA